jgi:transcription elongation factor Elf1
MYECFHCGAVSVVWDADFSYEDFGLDGSGLVHVCHCGNCGARITYEIDCEEDANEERV